jgi:hypothetical protein
MDTIWQIHTYIHTHTYTEKHTNTRTHMHAYKHVNIDKSQCAYSMSLGSMNMIMTFAGIKNKHTYMCIFL